MRMSTNEPQTDHKVMIRVGLGLCEVEEKYSVKRVMSRQSMYKTGQKIINPTRSVYKRVDLFINNVTHLSNCHVGS